MYLPLSRTAIVGVLLFSSGISVTPGHGGELPKPADGGYAALAKGDFDTAIARFDDVVRNEPKNSAAYRGRGLAYGMKGNYDLAIAELTKAIELDPREATAYRCRGGFYIFKGDYDRAIDDCDAAIRRNLRDSPTYNNRGYAYLSKGNVEKAVGDFTEAIRLDPKASISYANRGLALFNQRAYDRAIPDLDEALLIDRKNVAALQLRCGCFGNKGEWDRALADINEAICLDPKSSQAYRQRASIYARRGESGRAAADFAEAIRVDPGNLDAYASRAGYFSGLGRDDKAIADLSEAIRLSPQSSCLYEGRGALWIECNDYGRGIKDIETAIRLNPADPAATFESWPKGTIGSSATQHGERQLRQMLRDRPAMGRFGERAAVLYEWAVRKFAGEDLGRKIFWDVSDPPPFTSCANDLLSADGPGVIQVCGRHVDGPNKDGERSFDELWRDAVFELYNVTNAADFRRAVAEASTGKLSKEDFVNKIMDSESLAAEKTRAFYIHVVMHWAKRNRVPTHPSTWYLARRSNSGESLLRLVTEKDPYWRAYARRYDLIVLDSLARKGEYQKAIELATEAGERAETPAERAAICLYIGCCSLRLNKPVPAIDAFSEIIRFAPTYSDAFLWRAAAYRMVNDNDHAIADCSEAIRLKPSNRDAYVSRGNAYAETNDKARASADYTMANQLMGVLGQGKGAAKREGDGLPGVLPPFDKGWRTPVWQTEPATRNR